MLSSRLLSQCLNGSRVVQTAATSQAVNCQTVPLWEGNGKPPTAYLHRVGFPGMEVYPPLLQNPP